MYMNCFTETYYQTTNPKTDYKELISMNVGKSIFFHTVMYIGFLYLLQFVSNLKIIESKHLFSLTLFLIMIMILGYLGRLMRAKAVYEKELTLSNEEDALKNTKRIMDNAYFTWFFLS